MTSLLSVFAFYTLIFLKVGHNEEHILYFDLASVYANRGEGTLLDLDHCLRDQCNHIQA